MKQKEKFSAFLGIFGISFFIYLGLLSIGLTKIWSYKTSDYFYNLFPNRYNFSKEVVILDIDESSLAFYANHPYLGRWPWKRTIYPNFYSFLSMSGAKEILFDILFTERSDDDPELAQNTSYFPNISLAAVFRDGATSPVSDGVSRFQLECQNQDFPIPTFSIGSFPVPKLLEATSGIHVVNVFVDKDGILRRFPLLVAIGERFFPTLALKGFLGWEGLGKLKCDADSFVISKGTKVFTPPLTTTGFVRGYFYSEEEIRSIPRYSASGVLESLSRIQEGKVQSEADLIVNPTAFEGKTVLIGTSAAATHDDILTPFGLFPGVISQAIFLSNLIEGHFLKEIPFVWNDLLLLLLVFGASAWLFFSTENWVRLAIAAILLASVFILSGVLFYNGIVLNLGAFLVTFPISFLGGLGYLTYAEGKEKRKYSSILSNLVDSSVVKGALENLEVLKKGGEWEITAFFSDVAGFSGISEELSATDLAKLLNEYLSAMTLDLKANGGTLDKYIGDAIVGIFGAPVYTDRHVQDSCIAALQMKKTLELLHAKWEEEMSYTPLARKLKFRIGLNCGKAKVGFMGTDSLASYTMMGDTVNLASRLEAAAKDYGTSILVSQNIQERANSEFHFRFLDCIRVKGKNEPIRIFSLESQISETASEDLAWQREYEEAFQNYQNQNWPMAKDILKSLLAKRKDVASEMLLERVEYYESDPPGSNWDGVFTRTIK